MLYHSARGSVGYTIVGSPTIVDGVASGFSTTKYLKMPIYTSGTDIFIKTAFVRTENDTNIRLITNNISAERMIAINYAGGHLKGSVTINNTRYQVDSSVTIVAGTKYYAEVERVGTKLKIRVSTDNNTWVTDEIDIPEGALDIQGSEVRIGANPGIANVFWNGTIDLNKTYIKVDGQPWFGISPVEVKKHQIMGPVGYTVSGSPSTENGVLTNVSRTNRIYTSLFLPNFETLEVLLKAKKYTSWRSRVLCLCGFGEYNSEKRITTNDKSGENQGTRLFFNASGIIVSIDNSKFDVTQYAQLGYYTRLRVTKNTEDYTYELGLSADKQSWVTATANYEDNICTGQVYFLQNSSGVYQTDEMSLNETYIKVNGKLWFWQPQETKRIVVNGVDVWTKPE